MKKKIYIIWIGWIWISAIARYYNENWYQVFWSDKTDSELIKTLISEWIDIKIWERPEIFETKSWKLKDKKNNVKSLETQKKFELVIYTEAIPKTQSELKKALDLWIKTLSYPEAVWEIANEKKFITISGSHWKSTTTALVSLIFKNSDKNFTSIVWTLLKEFGWKNYYQEKVNWFWDLLEWNNIEEYFIIEACEYRRSFLSYTPDIVVITNIDIDHLDYYKDENDYVNAFRQLIDNIKIWWYVILNWQERNSKSLIWLRQDINYIEVQNSYFILNWEKIDFPKIELNMWDHINYDARLTYIVWVLVWIEEKIIIDTLQNYKWAWRRMEILWNTKNNNIVISDYWHHPTEIKTTLKAIKNKYKDRQILTVFQPHQYNRTIELLEDFIDSFQDTDKLIVPDIYESRDTKEDKEKMNAEILVQKINHPNKLNWNWLENTLKLIKEFDEKNKDAVIILLWAGNVDDLRYGINFEK